MLYFCLAVMGILGSALGIPAAPPPPPEALVFEAAFPFGSLDPPSPPSDSSLLPAQPILLVTEFNSFNPPIQYYTPYHSKQTLLHCTAHYLVPIVSLDCTACMLESGEVIIILELMGVSRHTAAVGQTLRCSLPFSKNKKINPTEKSSLLPFLCTFTQLTHHYHHHTRSRQLFSTFSSSTHVRWGKSLMTLLTLTITG